MGGESAHLEFLVLAGCFLLEKEDLLEAGVKSHKINLKFWESSYSHYGKQHGGFTKN